MFHFVTLQMEEDAGGCSAPPPEEGYLLVRIHVPELNVQKCLQFPRDQLVWDVKQQCLAALPKVKSNRSTVCSAAVSLRACSQAKFWLAAPTTNPVLFLRRNRCSPAS
jgi:hypothetical protein